MIANLWRALTCMASPGGDHGRLSILFFHRVLAERDPLAPYEPSAAQFDAMMRWVGSQFAVLPLEEAVTRLHERTLPRAAAAITFDDGYGDNLHIAAPILKRHGLPATFFISTGFLDGGIMFNDAVTESIRQHASEELSFEELALHKLPLRSPEQFSAAIGAVLRAVKHLPFAERQDVVGRFVRHCKATLPADLMMTKAEVQQLSRDGFTIGAHTVHHPILTKLSLQECQTEMLEGRRQLQELTDSSVDLFAYPNGREGQDYDQRHRELARECGFSAAFSTEPFVCTTETDRWRLPRFTPWDRTRTRFQARLLAHQRRTLPARPQPQPGDPANT